LQQGERTIDSFKDLPEDDHKQGGKPLGKGQYRSTEQVNGFVGVTDKNLTVRDRE
jgi:hypothetical protein